MLKFENEEKLEMCELDRNFWIFFIISIHDVLQILLEQEVRESRVLWNVVSLMGSFDAKMTKCFVRRSRSVTVVLVHDAVVLVHQAPLGGGRELARGLWTVLWRSFCGVPVRGPAAVDCAPFSATLVQHPEKRHTNDMICNDHETRVGQSSVQLKMTRNNSFYKIPAWYA